MKQLNILLQNLWLEACRASTIGRSSGCLVLFLLITLNGYTQDEDPQLAQSNNYIFEGNSLVNENFIEAEKKYRLGVSTKQNNATGSYNLGNAYYNSKLYDEAMSRHLEAVTNSRSKTEKHKAYHNIGNALMQKKTL